jgi:hypothetical protein
MEVVEVDSQGFQAVLEVEMMMMRVRLRLVLTFIL